MQTSPERSAGRVLWRLRDGRQSAPEAVCRIVPQSNGYALLVDGLGTVLRWQCAEEASATERAKFLAAQMVALGWTREELD